MPSLGVDGAAAVERLAQQLRTAARSFTELEPVYEQAGAVIAAAPAPRRSGQLAASVRADVTPNGVTVGSDLAYASFVHWGAPRRNVRAQPWLLTEVETAQSELVGLFETYAAHVVARIGD